MKSTEARSVIDSYTIFDGSLQNYFIFNGSALIHL